MRLAAVIQNVLLAPLGWLTVPENQLRLSPLNHASDRTTLTFNETVVHPESLRPKFRSIRWLPGEEDGLSIYMSDKGDLIRENYITGTKEVFVPSSLIPDDYHEFWVRPDQDKILFATNYTKQYRWSYFANYFILDIASSELTPLVNDQHGDIQYAVFAPVGENIAYVRGNNLHITNDTAHVQITMDGSPNMFHGVTDWVFEEEVFGHGHSLWFSPDGTHVAFLSFNETGVDVYHVPYFMSGQTIAPPYPRELALRYPKPGRPLPTVHMKVLDIARLALSSVDADIFEDGTIIGQVVWMTNGHSKVAFQAFNRVQDRSKTILANVETANSTIEKEMAVPGTVSHSKKGLDKKVINERNGQDGWIDNVQAMAYIGIVNGGEYYVDISDSSGWYHLYLVPLSSGRNITLTSGDWEVTSVLKIDSGRKLIYFTATTQHSTERHIYSVSYDSFDIKPLVRDQSPGSWSASFSVSAGFYVLSQLGPGVPKQELYSVGETNLIRVVEDNDALSRKLASYNLPNITYLELHHPDGYSLNVMQHLPPNFNHSQKYPTLFNPYGGPGSQQVSKQFHSPDFTSYLASDPELEYITYVVDGRGTGYKGRAFRSTVSSMVGVHEAEDQIWAAQELIKKFAYIDTEHVAMWGWSFGGYLTSKVVEANSGVFSLGLITAPVTDWRLYDAVYTERYMKLPTTNANGYAHTAVHNTTGFKDIAGGFAIMHGTGDDNVHYQNTAALVDLLVRDGVSPDNLHMMAFTDSDHRINYDGAGPWIYRYLAKRLWAEKQRVPGKREKHQWSKREIISVTPSPAA